MPNPSSSFDVLLTVNYSPWSNYHGGGQKSTHMLAEAFASLGCRVAVIYTKSLWEKITVPADIHYHVQFATFFGIRPGISSPLRWLNGLTVLRQAKKLSSTKTLVIGNGDEASLLWRLKTKALFIFACRNTYDTYLNGQNWSRAFTWIRAFFREPRDVAVALAIRRSNRIAVSSHFTLQQIQASFGIQKEKSLIIPNGIDDRFFGSVWKDRGQNGVLFFGRLAHNKGPHLALGAYAKLPEALRLKHPLRLIGDGPMRKQLASLSEALGIAAQVHFLGWVETSKIPHLITENRAVLLPSLEESFGNAILETLATGAPLITTEVCAIPEVAGPFAKLVSPDNEIQMSQSLELALTTARTETEINAQIDYVRNHFSWKSSAQAYLKSRP